MKWEKQAIIHENQLPNRPDTKRMPFRVIKKIKEINKWDLRLIEYAKERWS